MEPFDIKINYFGGRNHHRRQLSLSTPKSDESLSLLPPKKGLENEKNNKIWYKIEFLKIKRTNYLIAKKNGGLN
jgi:hypothetical protein